MRRKSREKRREEAPSETNDGWQLGEWSGLGNRLCRSTRAELGMLGRTKMSCRCQLLGLCVYSLVVPDETHKHWSVSVTQRLVSSELLMKRRLP